MKFSNEKRNLIYIFKFIYNINNYMYLKFIYYILYNITKLKLYSMFMMYSCSIYWFCLRMCKFDREIWY